MAAAGGEGTAGARLLPAGAALALLGGLVYLGALCAACKRYVLPTAPPLSLLGLGWGWGSLGDIWWLHVETLCAPILSWDRWDLLTPNPHLCPSAALPGLILHPRALQPPGTPPTPKNLGGAAQRGLSCERDGQCQGQCRGWCQWCPAQLRGVQDAIVMSPASIGPAVGLGKEEGCGFWECHAGDPGHLLLTPGFAICLGLSPASPCRKGRKKVAPDGVKLVDEVRAHLGGRIGPGGWSGLSAQPEGVRSPAAGPAPPDAAAVTQQVGHEAARAVPGEGQRRR